MRNILCFLLVLIGTQSYTQTEGKITYEEKIDIHRRMTGERAQFKDRVPQFRTVVMELYFDDDEAVYRKSETVEEEAPPPQAGGGRGRFRMRGGGSGVVYQNYAEDRRVEQRNFMDKKFLIRGEPERKAWKLTGESMQVGQYLCQKATFQDSTDNIVAWFTPQIAVPLGPAQYGQLPGLVLHVDINEGERTYTAQTIELDEIDTSVLKEPTKGKEVTQEEFQTLVREKVKEMRANGFGGRGRGGRN